ncbi:hypothetical protein HMPREF9621_01782 [Cutibacterium modestum HL037PA2]|nr:hypothetical protein HMPREF9621_01782 [Cutibacterium modestum HL037PA2]
MDGGQGIVNMGRSQPPRWQDKPFTLRQMFTRTGQRRRHP